MSAFMRGRLQSVASAFGIAQLAPQVLAGPVADLARSARAATPPARVVRQARRGRVRVGSRSDRCPTGGAPVANICVRARQEGAGQRSGSDRRPDRNRVC